MKRLLIFAALAVFLLPAATVSAQGIFWDGGTIPDPAFRSYVLDNFDTDRDGRISKTEADAVVEMYISGEPGEDAPYIHSLEGIDHFTNLNSLYCSLNGIEQFNLNNSPHLKELYCRENAPLTSLNLSGCPALEILDCSSNQLNTLEVNCCPALKNLSIYENNISSINLSACPKLEILNCGRNNLSKLNLNKNPKLQQLFCDGNELTQLNLSSCPSLTSLNCQGNPLESLDVSGLQLTDLGIPSHLNCLL